MMLEVSDIFFRHAMGDDILKGISFSARKGEVTVILGPNGSGKSTLFKCILGIWKPYRGRVKADGRDITSLPFRERAKRFSYVPQGHEPSFPYKVLEVVLMGRAAYIGLFSTPGPRDYEEAERALFLLGIEHLRDRPYTRISGGERQMVLLARALAQGAPYMLLDEPTSHLDFRNQVLVLSKVRELAQGKGISVLLTLHDPNLASLFGDRILVLNGGKVIKDGPPDEVIDEELIEDVYGVRVSVSRVNGKRLVMPMLGSDELYPL